MTEHEACAERANAAAQGGSVVEVASVNDSAAASNPAEHADGSFDEHVLYQVRVQRMLEVTCGYFKEGSPAEPKPACGSFGRCPAPAGKARKPRAKRRWVDVDGGTDSRGLRRSLP